MCIRDRYQTPVGTEMAIATHTSHIRNTVGENGGELVKALRIVRNEILCSTRALVRVKLRGSEVCRLGARVYERHIRTHRCV